MKKTYYTRMETSVGSVRRVDVVTMFIIFNLSSNPQTGTTLINRPFFTQIKVQSHKSLGCQKWKAMEISYPH